MDDIIKVIPIIRQMIPHILTDKITFLLLWSFFICKKAVSGDFNSKKNLGNISNKTAIILTIIPQSTFLLPFFFTTYYLIFLSVFDKPTVIPSDIVKSEEHLQVTIGSIYFLLEMS